MGRQQRGTGPSPFLMEVEGDCLSSPGLLLTPHPRPLLGPPLSKAQQPSVGLIWNWFSFYVCFSCFSFFKGGLLSYIHLNQEIRA